MATPSKMTIRVDSARGRSNVRISTSGRYLSLTTNTIGADLLAEPVQPTASEKAYWLSVVAIVTAYLNTL
ncbi:MAG TPA: hypothetical protein VGX22_15755 [Candidatus Dormibacteraeota bacterium]|nr:hypothetical protein [Candidatus Dormibacteraeota bacterium]